MEPHLSHCSNSTTRGSSFTHESTEDDQRDGSFSLDSHSLSSDPRHGAVAVAAQQQQHQRAVGSDGGNAGGGGGGTGGINADGGMTTAADFTPDPLLSAITTTFNSPSTGSVQLMRSYTQLGGEVAAAANLSARSVAGSDSLCGGEEFPLLFQHSPTAGQQRVPNTSSGSNSNAAINLLDSVESKFLANDDENGVGGGSQRLGVVAASAAANEGKHDSQCQCSNHTLRASIVDTLGCGQQQQHHDLQQLRHTNCKFFVVESHNNNPPAERKTSMASSTSTMTTSTVKTTAQQQQLGTTTEIVGLSSLGIVGDATCYAETNTIADVRCNVVDIHCNRKNDNNNNNNNNNNNADDDGGVAKTLTTPASSINATIGHQRQQPANNQHVNFGGGHNNDRNRTLRHDAAEVNSTSTTTRTTAGAVW